MKRRNFLGLTGLAAVPFIPALWRQTQKPQGRTPIRPSIKDKVLPPVKPDRRTRGGTLCPANAQKIAAKIEEMFAGKVIAIASSSGNKMYGVDIETDAEMVADWSDHSKRLVKASINDEGIRTSLCFTCGDCFYIFDSRAKNSYARNDFKDAYLYFDRDKLTVQQRAPSGNLCIHVFRVQYEGSIAQA